MLACPLPAWKRTMDIFGASLGLVLFSPFLLLHTLIVKIISPGPVFFRQQRIGYLGRPFTMWKLRTMDVGVDTSYHQQHVSGLISSANRRNMEKPMTKLDHDPQIIPGAMLLRKLCLDEVPQLINVFRGDMSLVGPRPPLTYEVEEFLKWQHRRFDVFPGMTGLWQVSGKNRLTFSKMVRLDIQYARQKSFWLDILILLRTPLAIISQIRDSLALQREQKQLVAEGENA
jgi:lipopolysaccharide/colanic/teichoic acid biosynthesis glycosyltransferase